MNQQTVLNQIYHKLIVSCQARVGWPMYGSEIMAAFAKAAQEGGAAGIRATGVENIMAIKKKVSLPIIGINKIFSNSPVYITPTYQSAKEILQCGIEIIALDATQRLRPNQETYDSIVQKIRKEFPNVLIMAEISTIEDAQKIIDHDYDLISTTLSGYTEESKDIKAVNFRLIQQLSEITKKPIIAEGKIQNEYEASKALKCGAFSVVVGTSITRPEVITSRYVKYLERENE